MKRNARIFTVLLATAALVGWVACGGDDGDEKDTTTTDTVQEVSPEVIQEVAVETVEEVTHPDAVEETAPEVVQEVVEEVTPEVVEEVICVPSCGTRVCGDDGCGGSCGDCGTDKTCDPLQGICIDNCDWATDKPMTWGPVGAVSALQTPADAEVVKATCFDYTADGLGDNGLKGLAGQVNGPLADAVNGGDIAILFELFGVTDFQNTASFQLNGLMGESTAEPPATTGDFYIDESSYVTEICQPMIYFKNAKIENGVLSAGPSEFRLSIPISEEVMIDATLIQAQLKGTIANGDAATGFELTGGVLSGVLTKEELQTAIDTLQAECDAAPATDKPSYCSYLTVAKSAMNLLFDMHQVKGEDGSLTFVPKSKENPGDAASVCLTYTLSKAKVIGYKPATE